LSNAKKFFKILSGGKSTGSLKYIFPVIIKNRMTTHLAKLGKMKNVLENWEYD